MHAAVIATRHTIVTVAAPDVLYAVAFPIALMASVREDVNMEAELQKVLLPDELQLLKQQQHAGTAVLQAMGQCVRLSATAKDIEQLRIDESISVLQVGCSREAWLVVELLCRLTADAQQSSSRRCGQRGGCWIAAAAMPHC
jgi:hypothetical protein